MNATKSALLIVTQTIRSLILISKPFKTPKSSKLPLPTSWLCHECIYILGTAPSVENIFGIANCQGCSHERCGICDVIYTVPNQSLGILTTGVGVVTGERQFEGLLYHWDTSQNTANNDLLATMNLNYSGVNDG